MIFWMRRMHAIVHPDIGVICQKQTISQDLHSSLDLIDVHNASIINLLGYNI